MGSQREGFLKRGLVLGFFLMVLFVVFLKGGIGIVSAQTETDWINKFSSEIKINKDSSVSIREIIDYETVIEKHGIYRYVPVQYQRGKWSYIARISEVKIEDETGKAVSYTDYKEGGNRVFKIGEADRTFVGKRTYVLEYRVENALKQFEEYDELYWDITGEGWKIPIKSSEAKIVSPPAVIKKIDCFSGITGGNDGLCKSSFNEKEAIFKYSKVIGYGQNFTVLIGLDKNNLIEWPTEMEKAIGWMRANFFMFLIPLPGLAMFLIWFSKGRDYMFLSANVFNQDESRPKKLKPLFYKHRMAFVYEPLKDLTPGEAGLLLDERVDNQDVIAEIVDLARKKYLKIEREERKGLFGKKEDYKFIKLKEADGELPEQQKYLLESIFGLKKEERLSALKGSFYQKMDKVRKLIQKSVEEKKMFTGKPSSKRVKFMILFFFLSAGSFFLAILGIGLTGSGRPMGVFVFQFIAGLILAYQMPQKTAIGTNLMLQAKGLRETIKRGKWREKIKEKNLFIEEVLPFAISLGVVKKLAKDMEGLNIKPPEYFGGEGLVGYAFGSMVSDFSAKASSGLSYNPSSSSWSGGSGFSGGGSSGGGGGGGGGGSW